MAYSEDFLNFILDQLSEFGEFTHKKMFGGVGFFREGKMFGGIMNGKFTLKVDESNKAAFEALDMKPFHSNKKGKGLPYWEVPPEILEDKTRLKDWADKSVAIALKNKK